MMHLELDEINTNHDPAWNSSNTVHPRETPTWQQPITAFFKKTNHGNECAINYIGSSSKDYLPLSDNKEHELKCKVQKATPVGDSYTKTKRAIEQVFEIVEPPRKKFCPAMQQHLVHIEKEC